MLDLKNIALSYPSKKGFLSLNELTLKRGEMVALIGQNGSGKSSLIKVISGLNKTAKGDVFLNGKNVSTLNAKTIAGMLSIVLTDAPYPYQMPLEEFVSFGRYPFTNWWLKQTESDQIAIETALEDCLLQSLRNKPMGELSDGERQRSLIARALTQGSDLLILDEPTTHLDGLNTINVLKLLKEQALQKNKGVLYSSHKIAESLQLADKLWVIHNGEVKEMSKEEFSNEKELQKALVGESFNYDFPTQRISYNMKG